MIAQRFTDRAAEVLVEPGVAEGDRLEGLAQFGERAVLVHEAVDTRLHEGADDVGLLLAGEDQHLHGRQAAAEATEDLDAADAGHDDVEHQDVRTELQGQFDGALSVRAFARYFATRVGVHHLRDQVADRRLVLDHQHAFLGGGYGRYERFFLERKGGTVGGTADADLAQ